MVLRTGTSKEYLKSRVHAYLKSLELGIVIGPNRLESTKKLS
jgi:hypothetical protein